MVGKTTRLCESLVTLRRAYTYIYIYMVSKVGLCLGRDIDYTTGKSKSTFRRISLVHKLN